MNIRAIKITFYFFTKFPRMDKNNLPNYYALPYTITTRVSPLSYSI